MQLEQVVSHYNNFLENYYLEIINNINNNNWKLNWSLHHRQDGHICHFFVIFLATFILADQSVVRYIQTRLHMVSQCS